MKTLQFLCSIKIEWHSSGFYETMGYRYVGKERTSHIKQLHMSIYIHIYIYINLTVGNINISFVSSQTCLWITCCQI